MTDCVLACHLRQRFVDGLSTIKHTQNSLGHIKVRRGIKLAKQCFDKWAYLLKQRVIRLEHAVHLRKLVLQRRDTALCSWCYHAWWSATLGPHSRKRVAARGLQRMTDARNILLHRLSEQGMHSRQNTIHIHIGVYTAAYVCCVCASLLGMYHWQ
jgi:hypothetical protein